MAVMWLRPPVLITGEALLRVLTRLWPQSRAKRPEAPGPTGSSAGAPENEQPPCSEQPLFLPCGAAVPKPP